MTRKGITSGGTLDSDSKTVRIKKKPGGHSELGGTSMLDACSMESEGLENKDFPLSPNAHRKYYVTGRYLHCCCMSSRVVKHGTAVDFKKIRGGQ